ncbi:hypothetical protein GGX14DRAFT_674116 [Mycena pura]|uniref:F-box domain-containing protein n=1 Tax=Mycena pura TaxID=153505 RepID=A0AAD6UVF2_9AGAR|nr:hypothetical protein GGX14DRAFT_674116 [Mycena pura]
MFGQSLFPPSFLEIHEQRSNSENELKKQNPNIWDNVSTRIVLPARTRKLQNAVIDEEIAQITARLASLKAYKNSIAPISRLPTELLVEIFLRLPDLPCKIMNVCRHWHAISSATPALWTRIELDSWNRRHFRSQLRLSGDLPLTVSIRRLNSRRAASLVLEHAGRIASLSISGSDLYVFHFMQDMRHFAFPLLRSLVLHPSVDVDDDSDEVSIAGHDVMPFELLGCRMPSLRELRVYRINGSWQSLCALQSLSLQPAVRLPLHTLLAVLADCPEMHTLELDTAAARALDGRCHPVQLPLLKRLNICDIVPVFLDLLAHLVFPPPPPNPIDRNEYYFTITTLASVDSRAKLDNVKEDARVAVTTHPTYDFAHADIMQLVLSVLFTQSIVHLNIVEAAWGTECMAALALLPALETVTLMLGKSGTLFCEAVLDTGRAHMLRGINVYARVPTAAAEHTAFINMLVRLLDSCRQSGRPLSHLKLKVEVVNEPVDVDDVGGGRI